MFAVAIPCKRDLTALTLLQSGFMPMQHLAEPDDRLLSRHLLALLRQMQNKTKALDVNNKSCPHLGGIDLCGDELVACINRTHLRSPYPTPNSGEPCGRTPPRTEHTEVPRSHSKAF